MISKPMELFPYVFTIVNLLLVRLSDYRVMALLKNLGHPFLSLLREKLEAREGSFMNISLKTAIGMLKIVGSAADTHRKTLPSESIQFPARKLRNTAYACSSLD